MKLLICRCQQCKHGRKHIHDRQVKDKVQGAKARVRAMLKRGEYEELPTRVEIGYTD